MKHHKRIKKIWETINLKYIYNNEFNQACFAQDAAYSDTKELTKRTLSEKILKGRAYEIARKPIHDKHQRISPNIVCMFFDNRIGIRSKCKWSAGPRNTQTSD